MLPLVSFQSISRVFRQTSGFLGGETSVYAVRDVSLDIYPGETLGVVGESGSGKSTLGRMALGLLEPTSGNVRAFGLPVYRPDGKVDAATFRSGLAGKIQMVFQDPYASLNPRMRIGKAVEEPLLWYGEPLNAEERTRRAGEMLERVGLGREQGRRFPHEFSGGQRQRIAIARALVTRPVFVVCDEPTSSLDASVQAQVLNLLKDLREDMGLSYMFISHDLAVIRHMADRVAVMYQGLIVEQAQADRMFSHPQHPYTRLLLESIPLAYPGEGPDPEDGRNPDTGNFSGPSVEGHTIAGAGSVLDRCPFLERCPVRMPRCALTLPDLLGDEGTGHQVRCLLYSEPE